MKEIEFILAKKQMRPKGLKTAFYAYLRAIR